MKRKYSKKQATHESSGYVMLLRSPGKGDVIKTTKQLQSANKMAATV